MTTNPEPRLMSAALLEQAEQLCRRRLASDPEAPAAVASLAQLCRKQGLLREAATLYAKLRQLQPDDKVAAYMHAILAGTDLPDRPAGLHPAPFVLFEGFLPREFHETLVPFVLSVEEQLVPAQVAAVDGGGEYNPDTRQSLDLPGEFEVKTRFRECVRSVLPEVLTRLQVAPFDVGEFEVKVRVYLDGHFFRIHMDCPPKPEKISRRTVSYVYFFHRMPRAYTGGDLLLFDTNTEKNSYTTSAFTRVIPEDNSLIMFPSAFFHSVIPVSCPSQAYADSRFVINGHISKRGVKRVVDAGAAESPAPEAVS